MAKLPLTVTPGVTVWTAAAGIAAAVYGANKFLNAVALKNTFGPLRLGADASWELSKEVVLITGGSSGIGKAMVMAFVRHGVRVVVLDMASASFPAGVAFYQVDVTDADKVQAVAEQVRREVGAPTVLINNAGIGLAKTILDLTPEQIRLVFSVNAIAPFYLLKAFLPAMAAANHGHVVNMASVASFVVIANNVDYSCTKASMMALHEGLTQELRHRYNAPKVKTTIVHPYWTDTPLLSGMKADRKFYDNIMRPEVIADAVVEQVLSGRSGQLILPRSLSLPVNLLRSCPYWLQEWVRDGKSSVLEKMA